MLYHREDGLQTVRSDRLDRTEWFITVRPNARVDASVAEQTRDVYGRLSEECAALDARVLYERVYADSTSWTEVLSCREQRVAGNEAFGGPPPTVMDGGPCEGEGLAGVQIWAVSGTDVRPVVRDDRVVGQRFDGLEGEYLMLSSVTGAPGGGRGAEAERMFESAARVIEAEGLSFQTDILRTWIYLDGILEWYDEFNRARSAVFLREGITSPQGFLPASTGIGFRVRGSDACAMDVLALHRRPNPDVTVRRCYNPLQNEAPEYGSAFTRGTQVTADGVRTLLVSGTAAIDEKGRTVFPDDARRQMRRTIENIQALMAQSGLDWSSISQGTVFLPTPDLLAPYREVTLRLGLPPVPLLVVTGVVCRDDLWVEIEVTANRRL